MITYTTHETTSHVLTPEGAQIALKGSHEARVWNALPAKGEGTPLTLKELESVVSAETAKIGQSRGFKNKWIGKEGNGLVKIVRHFMYKQILSRIYMAGPLDRRYHPT